MEDKYQIYLITNTVNNKKYVGQTRKDRSYLERFEEHKITSNRKITLLYSAMRHYGVEQFKVELLEDNVSLEEVDAREIYYIKKYNTYYKADNSNGYNMTTGGQGVHNYVHTEETKQKIIKSSKETWLNIKQSNPELFKLRNESISKKLTGKKFSEEHKKHLSDAAKKRTGEKNSFYGKHHSEDTKKKISESNGHPVCMCDKITGEEIMKFSSVADAAAYLIDNNLTKNKTAFTRIITVCNNTPGQGSVAYGYKWKYFK